MELTVKLEDVMEAVELHSFESNYYYSKKDGKVYFITEDELRAADDYEDIEDFPDLQQDNIKIAEDILWSFDYIKLPDNFDINDYEIMEDFCLSLEDKNLRDIMYNSIQGRGAFSRFKDNIHKYGIADDWYDFQEDVYIQIAKDWCEENNIKCVEEKPKND